jgi:hypothetical protein
MSIVSRALLLSLAGLLLAGPASAAITDPEMSCAQYLKAGPHHAHKANHAKAGATSGDVDARVRAFCAANPKMKAMDAEIAVEGD